ncbi:hypothetical protein FB45DRAFT_945656 [Roridomyces roridus]|uniref:MYND-type domain-containing protein n=1 Tax=Roridomyces roridus TaxID=1738132 RepID=A0AAD7B3J2_9AGAR|nr:hypothetical protein FB45DRAFT_945656 [Roridomyces roridus]
MSTSLCRHCGQKQGTLQCTGCRKVGYCSNDCQLVSWKQGHKELCRGKETNKPLTPISPLDPPFSRMTLAEERLVRQRNPWELASACVMTLDKEYLESGDPEIYFAIPDAPIVELIPEGELHISDQCAPLDLPHSTNEILCEFTLLNPIGPIRYRIIVPTPPDFLAANERACDLGPPYRASEELCNRTATGLQQSFARQIFAHPGMWACANLQCADYKNGTARQKFGPRKALVGSKLVHRTRKPALEDIWAPCCDSQKCVDTVRDMLMNAMMKTKR